MKKGNTVLITIKTDMDLTSANEVEAAFRQKGMELIKSGDSVTVDEGSVHVLMTDADTSLFEAGRLIPMEIRAHFDNGTLTSNIMYRSFDGTLKGEKYECKFRTSKCCHDR